MLCASINQIFQAHFISGECDCAHGCLQTVTVKNWLCLLCSHLDREENQLGISGSSLSQGRAYKVKSSSFWEAWEAGLGL